MSRNETIGLLEILEEQIRTQGKFADDKLLKKFRDLNNVLMDSRDLFSVTFERVTPASAALGDAEERGYVIRHGTLKDCLNELPLRGGYFEPSESHSATPRWVTYYKTNDGTRDYYETGTEESRSLHFPRGITKSSHMRVMRLLKKGK